MAGKKNIAKLHHYVPQGYLRGFADGQRQITTVPLARPEKPFKASVRRVAAQNRFYTVEGMDEPDLFEKRLSGVEGTSINIIKAFEKGHFPPTEDDRWALAAYMALQAVRGPDARATRQHVHASLIRLEIGLGGRRNVGSWIRENTGVEPTPELEDRIWAQATQPGGPPIELDTLSHIHDTVETAEELTPSVALRPWILVRFNQESLLTSDAPVSLIRSPDTAPWKGVGFETAAAIAFPLTRKLGLLMVDPTMMRDHLDEDELPAEQYRSWLLRGAVDQVQRGNTDLENYFNEHTAASAREYIYHHPEDERCVPDELPEPNLIMVDTGGAMEMEFDGAPRFAPREEHDVDGDSEA